MANWRASLTEEEKEELIEMLQSHIEDLRVHEFKN